MQIESLGKLKNEIVCLDLMVVDTNFEDEIQNLFTRPESFQIYTKDVHDNAVSKILLNFINLNIILKSGYVLIIMFLQIAVKFVFDIEDAKDTISKYRQLESLLRPNLWFKFVNAKVDEDSLTHRIFLSLNIKNDEDFCNSIRKFVNFFSW